jgi:hypothetical protein
MHIVEIILVTLLLFFVLSQFVLIQRSSTDWPKAKLYLLGNDVLISMNRMVYNDADWFDSGYMKSTADSLIHGSAANIIYSMTLRNVVPPEIKVSCGACTEEELNALKDALRDFSLNGMNIHFSVTNESNVRSLNVEDYDVTVFFDPGRAEFSRRIRSQAFNNFLRMGKGVILISDLQDPIDSAMASALASIFGINRENVLVDANDIWFTDESDQVNKTVYMIKKYYDKFPSSLPTKVSRFASDMFFSAGDKRIVQIGDRGKVLLRQATSGATACVVNDAVVNGNGRAVWLSKPDMTRMATDEDVKLLLRSIVAWAAGDYRLIKTNVQNNVVSVSLYRMINGSDMFEPMEVVLDLGYSY